MSWKKAAYSGIWPDSQTSSCMSAGVYVAGFCVTGQWYKSALIHWCHFCCFKILWMVGQYLPNINTFFSDVHLVLNRNTEQQIMKCSASYGISKNDKLFIEQELLLWLSCFIVCPPWILLQCETTSIPKFMLVKIFVSELLAAECKASLSWK